MEPLHPARDPSNHQTLPVNRTERRHIVLRLLWAALAAVDPEVLTKGALASRAGETMTLIAIGKASASMARGAGEVARSVRGICVSNYPAPTPRGVDLLVGDHPVPGPGSFTAGRRVLDLARQAPDDLIALISGGGSALCEHPVPGVSEDTVSRINRRLLDGGASIAEINLVRRHLSAIKNGGLARAAGRPIETYAISDVCGEPPRVIASGPTSASPFDPQAALQVLARHEITIPEEALVAIRRPRSKVPESRIEVVADGHTATSGAVRYAAAEGIGKVGVAPGWLSGDVSDALNRFIDHSPPGLTLAAGEPAVAVTGDGRGGRNTHAALMAASLLNGTDGVFAAFATDGVDGNSSSAGAIVDGTTIETGGDPKDALERSDSATYLDATGDLIRTGPTGTNVADIWTLWK